MSRSGEFFQEILRVIDGTLGWDFVVIHLVMSLLMGLLIFWLMARLLVDTMDVTFLRAAAAWGVASISALGVSVVALMLSSTWLLEGSILIGFGLLLVGVAAIAVVPCLTFSHFFQCETSVALMLFVTPLLPQALYGQPLAEALTWKLTTTPAERDRLEDFFNRFDEVIAKNRTGDSEYYLKFLRQFNEEPHLRELIARRDLGDLNYEQQIQVERLLIDQGNALRERENYTFLMTETERAAFLDEVREFNLTWQTYQNLFLPAPAPASAPDPVEPRPGTRVAQAEPDSS